MDDMPDWMKPPHWEDMKQQQSSTDTEYKDVRHERKQAQLDQQKARARSTMLKKRLCSDRTEGEEQAEGNSEVYSM